MTKIQIAAEIKRIVSNQLDDAKRAMKAGTKTIAVNELEDAVRPAQEARLPGWSVIPSR